MYTAVPKPKTINFYFECFNEGFNILLSGIVDNHVTLF